MRKVIICVGAVFVFAIVFILNPPHKSVQTSEIALTAEDLWSAFTSDRNAAEAQYGGETISLTGEIAEVSDAFMGKPCILLENGADSIPDGIFCFFPPNFDVSDYSDGDTITVSGECSIALHIAGDDTPFISLRNSKIVE